MRDNNAGNIEIHAGIAGLLKLIAENPDARILPMVDIEPSEDDAHYYRIGHWGEARLDEVYTDDGRVYIRSQDEDDELVEKEYENIECLSDDESAFFEKYSIARRRVNRLKWEKAIVVYITA